ncbi:MAG: hypothetical protein ABI273_05915, partial [Lacunisphaera sp.]
MPTHQSLSRIFPSWFHSPFLRAFFRVFAEKRTFVGLLFFAAGFNVFAASASSTPLELSDGRVFDSWSVLRQSDDSLTIKYSRGAVKISKALLPPDVLAKYPIVEPLQPAP